LSFCAALIAVSCGPLGDDDDDDPPSGDGGVVMSTYTPTVPGSTPQAVITLEAAQTAAVMTATEQALNPPPPTAVAGGTQPDSGPPSTESPGGDSQPSGTAPPNPPVNPNPVETQTGEAQLTPPAATLSASGNTIDGTLGSYIWLFNDPLGTVGFFPSSPLMGLTEVALTISTGAEAELQFSGDALQEPPSSVRLELYAFDENTAIPQSPSGQVVGDGSVVFGPKTDPVTTFDLQGEFSFAADFAPGHYVLLAHADWPDPQELIDSEIPNSDVFVAYTFNIIVE
jgi:hypothetical protein